MTGGERWETTPGCPAPVMPVATETDSRSILHYLPEFGRFTGTIYWDAGRLAGHELCCPFRTNTRYVSEPGCRTAGRKAAVSAGAGSRFWCRGCVGPVAGSAGWPQPTSSVDGAQGPRRCWPCCRPWHYKSRAGSQSAAGSRAGPQGSATRQLLVLMDRLSDRPHRCLLSRAGWPPRDRLFAV